MLTHEPWLTVPAFPHPESSSSSSTSSRFGSGSISQCSSLSSTFSDLSFPKSTSSLEVNPRSTTVISNSSKTDAFFASPFSPLPQVSSSPILSPQPAPARSLTAEFFSSPPGSAVHTPPTSLYTPSPALSTYHAPLEPRAPIPPSIDGGQWNTRLPPLARIFPSRYISDPTSTRDREVLPAKRDFLELDTSLPLGERGQRYLDDTQGEFGITPGRLDDFESPLEVDDQDTPSPPSSSDTHYTLHHTEPEPVLQSGSVLGGEVKLVKVLGRGGFSSVWLGERGGNVVAVKVAPSDDKFTRSSYEREAEIIKHIHHPLIIPLLSITHSPLALVLPYMPGSDLLDLVNSDERHALLSENVLKRVVNELVSAVGWLHSVGVVHRDLKLENILLTNPDFPSLSPSPHPPLISLTDFGFSRLIPSSPTSPLLKARCGSEAYAAPELVTASGGGWYDGRETDAWAVGVVVYALIGRGLPFGEGVFDDDEGAGVNKAMALWGRVRKEKERRRWLGVIARAEWSWPSPPSSASTVDADEELFGMQIARSLDAKKFVERLLVRDPKRRAKMKDVKGDRWLAGVEEAEGIGKFERDKVGSVGWREIE